MATVTDLVGPAGPLEALLDEPERRDVTDAPQGSRRVRTSAPAVRRDDAHQGGVSGSRRAWRASGARCCGSTFAASAAAPAHSIRATARRKTSRPRWITWRRDYPGAPLWAAGFSFGAWVALEVGATDDRVSALIGIAPPVATSDIRSELHVREHARQHQAEVLRSGRGRRGLPARRHVGVLRTARGTKGARRDRRRQSPVRRQGAGSRRGARGSAGDSDERRCHRLRRSHAGRQSAKRRASHDAA